MKGIKLRVFLLRIKILLGIICTDKKNEIESYLAKRDEEISH